MVIAHIETKKREDFPEFKDLFDLVESFMGYLPNAYLLMADKPDLMQAFAKMSASVFSADVLDIPSKQLIAFEIFPIAIYKLPKFVDNKKLPGFNFKRSS